MQKIISNRDLVATAVPVDDAPIDALWDFAHTFDGYAVWGGQDRCWEVGASVFDPFGPVTDDVLPMSLLKLRTALFAGCRARRFVDIEGDIEFLDLPDQSESLSETSAFFPTDATFNANLRRITSAIRLLLQAGEPRHRVISNAVTAAAAALEAQDAPKERDLRIAVAEALAKDVDEPIISSAVQREARIDPLPGWDRAPGGFDLLVGAAEQSPRIVAEMKWADRNTFSHAIWDVLKLIGALAKSAEAAYLIAGYPDRVWGGKSPFLALFADGTVQFDALPLDREWSFLLEDGGGLPVAIPRVVEVSEVCRVTVPRSLEPWELRAVAIEPGAGGWLRLPGGRLEDAEPQT